MTESLTPTEVWHYTDANGLLGMVRDRSIWAGCTDFMNDEKETIKGLEFLRSRWGAAGTESSNQRDRGEIERALGSMESSEGRQFIVSASEQSDSLTLWRNYGREAVSYAVCLSPAVRLAPVPIPKYWDVEDWPYAPEDYLKPYIEEYELPDGTLGQELSGHPDHVYNRQRTGWNKVEYVVDTQIEIVDRVAKQILETRDEIEANGRGPGLFSILSEMQWEAELTLIKDVGFRHEEEVRLHYYAVVPEWRFVHYRSTPLGATPYIVLTESSQQTEEADAWGSDVFEESPRRLPITAVRIGPTRYPDLAERGLRSLLDENGYQGVPVHRSEVPFR